MTHRSAFRVRLPLRGGLLAIAACALCLSSCGDSGPHEITEVRKIDQVDKRELMERSHRERFALALPKEQRRDAGPGAAAPSGWTFMTPEGWTSRPASGMRVATMKVPGNPPAEVSVFLLELSDMLENVNRWRRQMGAEPIQSGDLETLAYTHRGADALLVDVTGSYNESGKKERFLGLLKEHEGRLLSVKFVGGVEAVTENETKFHAFIQSLVPKPATGASNGGASHGAAPGADMAVGDEAGLKGRLRWETPAGWAEIKGASSQRIATFRIDGAPNLEVRVISLKGTGGGLEANAQMWAQMAGRKAPTPDEIKAFTRLEVLGRKAVLVEYTGQRPLAPDGEPVATKLLGLVCSLDGESLFVRVLGTVEEVDAQRAAFIALCKSLRIEE